MFVISFYYTGRWTMIVKFQVSIKMGLLFSLFCQVVFPSKSCLHWNTHTHTHTHAVRTHTPTRTLLTHTHTLLTVDIMLLQHLQYRSITRCTRTPTRCLMKPTRIFNKIPQINQTSICRSCTLCLLLPRNMC